MVKAAKTEAIPNTINPEFKTLNKKLFQIVCKGNKKTILKFTIKKFDNKNSEHKEYGYFTSTIEIIERNSKATFRLHQNGEETDMWIKFEQFYVKEKLSFGDYLKKGWFINMSVAIDYTASNGDPKDPESLHFYDPMNPGKKNQYVIAMEKVGKIMESYAFKGVFAGFGFGGIPPSQKDVSHCFNINED